MLLVAPNCPTATCFTSFRSATAAATATCSAATASWYCTSAALVASMALMACWKVGVSSASVYVPLGNTDVASPGNTTGRPVTRVWKLTSAATLVREIEVMTGGLAAVAAGLAAVTAGLAAGLGLGLTGLVLLFEVGLGTSPSVWTVDKGDPPGATYAGKNHPL